MSVPSDESLVDAVTGGNQDAFAVLVERYKGTVVGIALDVLRDKHAAEEVAQEAFVTAYERLNSLRDRGAFGCWLMTIARHAALRVVRARGRQRSLQSAGGADIADDRDRLDDRSRNLMSLVQRLPEQERAVVMLKYFDNHSVHEIAEMSGQAVGTVTKRLTRARRRLETWFKEIEQ